MTHCKSATCVRLHFILASDKSFLHCFKICFTRQKKQVRTWQAGKHLSEHFQVFKAVFKRKHYCSISQFPIYKGRIWCESNMIKDDWDLQINHTFIPSFFIRAQNSVFIMFPARSLSSHWCLLQCNSVHLQTDRLSDNLKVLTRFKKYSAELFIWLIS